MGRRGPKPTAKDVLDRRGSWRAKDVKKKRAPKAKPKPKLSIIKVGKGANKRPAMPKRLKDYAHKEWVRIIPILEEMGVLAEAHRNMLFLLCQAHDEYCKADDIVTSLLIKTKNNNIIQHPAVSIRAAAWERYRKACIDFGLSPQARTGLDVNKPKSHQKEDKSRFFDKNKA